MERQGFDQPAPLDLVNFQDLKVGPAPFALRVYYQPCPDRSKESWTTPRRHGAEVVGVAIVHLPTGDILPSLDRALIPHGFTFQPGGVRRQIIDNHFPSR